MDIYLRANTLLCGLASSNADDRHHIVRCIESAIDDYQHAKFLKYDLFLPNCFIEKHDVSDFWLGLATLVGEVEGWHALEYGLPLNHMDKRERYVYTWFFKGNEYKFYTKILNYGGHNELIWYLGKSTDADDSTMHDYDDEDTDEEKIHLHSI